MSEESVLQWFLSFFLFWFLSFLVWPLLPAHCRCRGLLLHFITLNDPHTSCRTPLDEWSARRRSLYITHNTYKKQTAMLPAGFEPAIAGSERLQTHALDRSATGSGSFNSFRKISRKFYCSSCRKLWHPIFFLILKQFSLLPARRYVKFHYLKLIMDKILYCWPLHWKFEKFIM